MSLEILVDGEHAFDIEGDITSVALLAPDGEKGRVGIPPEGYKQIELQTTKIAAGGPPNLAQLDRLKVLQSQERSAGLPVGDPPVGSTMTRERQELSTSTLDVSETSVEDARFAGDPDAPPPVDPVTGEPLSEEEIAEANAVLEGDVSEYADDDDVEDVESEDVDDEDDEGEVPTFTVNEPV